MYEIKQRKSGKLVMVRKQEQRSEETKNMILVAAGELFSQKGYDSVTMREIAKEAGCSHTTIYIYFKDKEALLHQLSMPALHDLHQQLLSISCLDTLTAIDKLKAISREYISFCMNNRNMYSIFINAKSSRVDEENPELAINQLRIEIFGVLMKVVQECLAIPQNEQLLAFTRIFYYTLNGILSTYSYPHEPTHVIMERLTPTFDLAVDILTSGFKAIVKKGEEEE